MGTPQTLLRGQSAIEEAKRQQFRERQLHRIGIGLTYAVLTVWAALIFLPLYWMFSTSLKAGEAVFQVPPQMIPSPISFQAYQRLLTYPHTFRWFLNSAIVALGVTIGRLVLASLAGYTLAKLRFPGKGLIFWAIVATMTIPDQVILIPLYSLILRADLLNTYWALILPALGSPFSIFLMKQFMSTLPSSLIDAARMDGCSEFGIYWKVILPLAKPGLAVLGIFSFTGTWNSFIWPLLAAPDPKMTTIQVGLTLLRFGLLDWGMLMAGASAAAIPVILVFLAFQRYFMRGLTIGAMKG
jgi:multiple sugar transport system permease protein